jgi:hypothetical protein
MRANHQTIRRARYRFEVSAENATTFSTKSANRGSSPTSGSRQLGSLTPDFERDKIRHNGEAEKAAAMILEDHR